MRRIVSVVTIVLAATAFAGCGEDDDDQDAAGQGDTTTTRSAQVAGYCSEVLEIETVPEPDIDFDKLSEAQQKEEAKKFVSESILPHVNKIKAGLKPAAISANLDVLIAAAERVAISGD